MDDAPTSVIDEPLRPARSGHDTDWSGGSGPDDPRGGGNGGRRGPGLWLVAIVAIVLGLGGGIGGYFIADAIHGDDSSASSSNGGVGATVRSQPATASKTSNADISDRAGSSTPEEIYKAAAPGVVHITSTQISTSQSLFNFGQQQESQASGSGFVIDTKGHIVTNAHVVDGAQKITVSFSEDHPIAAKLVGEDISSDLAVLSVDPDSPELKNAGLKPLTLADSNDVVVGDPVYAIGNPFNLDRTLTAGIISAKARQIQATNGFSINDVLQTDAPINPGNSGGPLLNAEGDVVGVNSQIASPVQSSSGEGQNAGIGFAIPSNTIKRVTDQLLNDGKVEHAYLGVLGGDLDGSIGDIPGMSFPVKEGVLIGRVSKGSPAEKAGLKGGSTDVVVGGTNLSLGGDIITKFAGTKITSMTQLADAVNGKSPGDQVEIEYYRGTSKKTVKVKLGDRPAQDQSSQSGGGPGGGSGGSGGGDGTQ